MNAAAGQTERRLLSKGAVSVAENHHARDVPGQRIRSITARDELVGIKVHLRCRAEERSEAATENPVQAIAELEGLAALGPGTVIPDLLVRLETFPAVRGSSGRRKSRRCRQRAQGPLLGL